MNKDFEPHILAFCCNWCAYAGADMAGVSRYQMPPSFRIIRVMCTGRVDPLFILHSLLMGADGVIVAGCHPGDCHYISGNIKAQQRVKFLKSLLEQTGLSDRIEMYYVSAGEGSRFGNLITEFTEKIRKLGPNPLKSLPKPEPGRNKRETFYNELVAIFRGLNLTPKPWKPKEDELIPGFGTPVFDPDKCVGCGACYQNCPENVIMMEDTNGIRKISHYHWSCITCRTCEEVCPNEAVKVEPGFDLEAFLNKVVIDDVKLPLIKCRICGNFFVPEPLLVKIKGEDVPLPADLLDVCPDCRKKMAAEKLLALTGNLK